MKTVMAWGWPIALILIGVGLIWCLVEDNARFGSGRGISPVGPGLAAAGVLLAGALLFVPASYEPI